MPPAGDHTFAALVFDWDGTAVPDRHVDAAPFRERVEALSAAGAHIFIVSGTHVGNVDGQLSARPPGPGQLHLCLNRGSEVFDVGRDGPDLVWQRTATAAEEHALDQAAAFTVERLRARGIDAQVVSQRLNRRKIDLIPDPAWADPPKAHIAELLGAVTTRLRGAGVDGLEEVVELAEVAGIDAGLTSPRVTSDVKHVEIGLTDKSDSARWAATWLAARGVTGALVLIGGDEFGPLGGVAGSDSMMVVPELARALVVSVGVEPGGVPRGVRHLGGGPERFTALLDAQLARRAERRVPGIDDDPAWVVPLPETEAMERAAESLGTLGNGSAATRASREEDGPASAPLLAVNGVYTEGPSTRLLHGPIWNRLDIHDGAGTGHDHRLLDLRTGVLARRGSLASTRFVSAARPFTLALRAESAATDLALGDLGAPGDAVAFVTEQRGDTKLAWTGVGAGAGIAVAARDSSAMRTGRRVVQRLAAWVATPAGAPSDGDVLERLADVEAVGFDGLLAEHREAWARRWADAEATIEGSAEDQLAARFALFHLLSAAPDTGEAAVGARGLSGDAYGGHVFWDADVFVLPALAAVRPAAARAMLEYRIRRLPAARVAAAARGAEGARFPWESAADGTDVTPRHVRDRRGELVPIRTGRHEEHIVADIAWAADHFARWTGDADLLAGPGRGLVVEGARYWANRIRCDRDGLGHLYGVMGPDEYHEVVDDNVFTNVMARWHLRRAADLLDGDGDGGDGGEASQWRALAGALVDGWRPDRNVYEQFAGYFDLEPLLVAHVAEPPVAIDVLLGAERVAGSQLIKQADVLMAHHLLPGEMVPGSLGPCLAFYGPRCAHGSSLSPAVHASVLARDGQPDEALELWRLAARLDLDDITGTTAGGLHLAAMGGVWQALAFGFLGLRAVGETLAVDPHLPAAWDALGLRFRFRGARVGVHAEHDTVTVSCDAPVRVRPGDGPDVGCEPPGRTFVIDRDTR